MKLLFCPECSDVLALVGEWRRCRCGASSGRYLDEDGTTAAIRGLAVPLVIADRSLRDAVTGRANGDVWPISAGVLPENHRSVSRTKP